MKGVDSKLIEGDATEDILNIFESNMHEQAPLLIVITMRFAGIL